jgi:LEA14-like dessication related protein
MKSRLLVIAALLAAGCGPRIEPVAVEFAGLAVESFERAELELAVHNPNRLAVDVEGLRYSLTLSRDTVALGARAEPVRVPARDSIRAKFPLELRFELDGIFGRLGEYLDDTLRLAIDGRYSVKGAWGPTRRPFSYRRAIPVRPEVDRLLGPLRSLLGGD